MQQTAAPVKPGDLEARACVGDRQAFAELIRAWDDDLRAAAWSVVRSASLTDDVLQATYEKALRALDGFEGRSSLKTWLHSICFRTAIDHVRHEARRRTEPLDQVLEPAATTTSVEADASARIRLASVLDALDPETRGLMMLTVGLGYSYDEVAAVTGIARGTVASRIGRARDALRREEL